jgi:hypothetical protein
MFFTSARVPKGRLAHGPDGHVGVAPHGPFFHVTLRRPHIAKQGSKGVQIIAGFFRRPDVRFRHNFHQWHTRAVQIHQRIIQRPASHGVEQFAGVFFQMDPLNAHGLFSTGFLENIQVPIHGQGQIVLGNLVVFRQVRVKILFAGEHRPRIDPAPHGQRGAHQLVHSFFVQYRQHAGIPATHRTNLAVGGFPEPRRARTKYFAVGFELNVHFQPDHRFIRRHFSPFETPFSSHATGLPRGEGKSPSPLGGRWPGGPDEGFQLNPFFQCSTRLIRHQTFGFHQRHPSTIQHLVGVPFSRPFLGIHSKPMDHFIDGTPLPLKRVVDIQKRSPQPALPARLFQHFPPSRLVGRFPRLQMAFGERPHHLGHQIFHFYHQHARGPHHNAARRHFPNGP